MDALEKRLKRRKRIFDKFFKSVNHHFFVTDKNYLKLMKLNKELNGLVQRGGILTEENEKAGLTNGNKNKIIEYITNKNEKLFNKFTQNLQNENLKKYIKNTYKKEFSNAISTAQEVQAPPGGVTSTTNKIDDKIQKIIRSPEIKTLSEYGQKRMKEGLKLLISGNNNKEKQGLEQIEEGFHDIFNKIPDEKKTDKLLILKNELMGKIKELTPKKVGGKRKQKGGALTEEQKKILTELIKEFLHEAEMVQLKKPNVKIDYTHEGNTVELCELDDIMTKLQRLKTEVSTLKIINSNGVKIDTYTDATLERLLTKVKKQMNEMDFTENDPNRMEKVYKGYYAILQNLITSIMFQRNLVDAYSKIIGVLKNINSKIKIGKSKANQNKEIKELKQKLNKLSKNSVSKKEVEKIKQNTLKAAKASTQVKKKTS